MTGFDRLHQGRARRQHKRNMRAFRANALSCLALAGLFVAALPVIGLAACLGDYIARFGL